MYNFDKPYNRKGTNCTKWDIFSDEQMLPMWIADMDFACCDKILDGIKARVDQLTGGVDDLGTFAGDMRGDLKDLLAFDQKIAVFIDPVAFVAADNGPGVSEQCLSHHSSSLSAK